MTREEYAKLTEEEIHTEIAHALKYLSVIHGTMRLWCHPDHRSSSWIPTKCLPKWTKDLNAMHEAEKVMDEQQAYRYGVILGGGHEGSDYELNDCFVAAHATAAQRAEAFVLTMSKEDI